jgi:hypothetical protein
VSRERWLRGDRDGRERPRDWSTLADEYGITPDEAAALHDLASREGEHEAAARPAPGKVARTMRLPGELTSAGWRTDAPGATGPGAATLLDHAQLYLGSARRDALAMLEAAAARADELAARRAWSSACSYLGLVEQCLVDAEQRAPAGAEAAAIARQVAEARAACAELSARGARILDRVQRPRPADTERERPAVPAAARGPGGEVPYRAEMEAAFGRSFRGVIAHTGAEEACDGLQARAYAVGETIVFASASPDRETVAHELTHVLQHRAARGSSRGGQSGVSRPGDASEREADRVAAQVAAGHAVRGPVAAAPSAAIHRRPEAPREVFEFAIGVEINRVSLSVRFKATRTDPAMATGDITAGENTTIKGGVGESKAALKLSFKRAGARLSGQLASALLRIDVSDDDIHVPGLPWLKIKADLKVLEGKVANLRGKDFDLDVLKVGVSFSGEAVARKLDPELAGTAADWKISVAGRADIPLTGEDLARITQMVRSKLTMMRSRRQIEKAKKQLKRLDKQHAELEKLRRGRTGAARKKLSRKLARLRDAKTAVRQRMVGLRHMGQRANEAFLHASSGLKSGAGKLVNKALVKATSKALAKVGAMLVPGLNVLSLAMTAWDLYELFRAMADGDDEAGAGGGQGGAGDGDVAGADASADAGVEGGADAGASDAGEDEVGGVVAGVNEGDAGDLDGGEDDAGDLDGGEDDAGGGETVELHPGAESVLELIEGEGGEPLDGAGREMLNDLVPRDLSDRELDALRERLAARPRGGSDVFATVGAVREEIERIREGEPTSRLVIDGKEYVDTPGGGVEEKQVAKGGDAGGGKRDEETPAIDDSHLFRPDIGDARQGVRWDAASGRLSIDEKWAAWVKKELRPRSAEGGVGRATSIAIASQRDVGAAGQPLIEYTIAIAVEIDVKGHIENHTEQYTFFYDPATGGHSREEAAGDLVAAFHSVLDFGEDGGVAIKGGGVYNGPTIGFQVLGAKRDRNLEVVVVRVKFTRTPPGWRVRTAGGWLTPSRDSAIDVQVPLPRKDTP